MKHEKKDQWTKLAKGGINGPIPTLFYDYDVEDVRRDITCVPLNGQVTTMETLPGKHPINAGVDGVLVKFVSSG